MTALSTTWQGADNGSWTTPGNWTAGVPGVGDTAVFNTSGGGLTTSSAGPANAATLQFTRVITISSSPLTLSTSITDSGAASGLLSVNISSASLVLSNDLTITLTKNTGIIIGSLISESGGSHSITLNSIFTTASTTWSGANTFSGGVNIQSGVVAVGGNSALGSGTVTIANGATLTLQSAITSVSNNISLTGGTANFNVQTGGSKTISGAITETAPSIVSKVTNAGTVIFSNVANNYSGGTQIATGTLQAGAANVFGTGSISLTAGTAQLNLAGFNQSVGGISSVGATQTIATNGGNLTTDSTTGGPFTFNGTLTGGGGVTFTGTGTQIFAGSSKTYTGGTTINASATLQLNANSMLSSSGTVTVNGTLALQGTTQSIGPITGTTGSITSSAGASLTSNSTSTTTYNGTISGATSFIFAGSGGGILTFGASNPYSGATSITGGTLRGGIANCISTSSALTMSNVAGAVFDLNSFDQSVGTLSGGGNLGGNITLGTAATLTVNQGADQTYGGLISDTLNGNLTKAGSSRLTLSQATTYTGTTSVQAGSLQASVANVIANSSSLTMSNVAGAVFDLNNLNQSINTLSGGGNLGGNITLGSGTLTVNQGSDQTYGGVISNSGNLIKAGSSRLTISQAATYTGTTSVQAGSLQASVANIIANSSALTMSNVAGAVFDLNSFDQSVGTLSGGGNLGGNITLGTAATLTVNQGSDQTYGGLISDTLNGNLIKAGSSRLTLSQATTYTGTTSIQAGSLQASVANVIANSSSLTMSNVNGAVFDLNSLNQSVKTLSGGGTLGGNITLGTATLTVNQGSDQTYGGAVSGSGQFFKQGAAKLTLTGSNNYTGLTTVAAGTLQGNTASLPSNIDNYSTLIWNQTSDGTYSHNISQSMGPGTMQVQGGGMLTTTGTLTQNTITVLSGGQMAIDGTATVPTVTVNSGGLLIGQGSITGNVDVFGSLGAGHDIGTLSVTGNYTQESGSTFIVQIVPSPPQVDLLEVSQAITLGDHVATFSLMPTIGSYPPNQQYVVMHGAGGVTGRFIVPITNSLPSFNATLHYTPLPTLSAEASPSLLNDPVVTYVILLLNTVTPSNLPVSPTALIAARCFDTIPNNPFAEFMLFMQIPQMNMTLTQMLPTAFGSLDLMQHDLITQVREVATREMNLFLKNPCESPKRFRLWTDLFFPRAVQHCRHNQMGYYSSAWGAALGFDFQVSPNSFFGVFATYAQDHLRGKGTDIDGWTHNVYGSCYAGGWISSLQKIYAQAVVSGAYDHYHTVRSIYFAGEQFTPFTEKPRARFHGSSGLGSFEMGKFWSRVARNQLYGRVDYSFNYRNHFREYNASVLDLKVKGHFSDFIRLELGDAISRCITLQSTFFDARLAAGGVLEYQINGKKQKASFATSSCVMSTEGPTLARAFLFWELGAQIHINKNYLDVIAGNFRGEYGSGFVSHNWSVEVKTSF